MSALGAIPTRYWSRASRIRSRLLVLAFIAAIPLALTGTVITWQGYKESERPALEAATILAGVGESQFLLNATAMQGRLASLPRRLDGEGCQASLTREIVRSPDLLGLAVLGADGTVRCAAPATAADGLLGGKPLPWFEQARGGAAYAIGSAGATDASVFAVPLPGNAVLAAILPPEWRALALLPEPVLPGSAIWIVGRTGSVVASRGSVDLAAPSAEAAGRLAEDGAAILANAIERSAPYAYAVVGLPDGWRVFAARPAGKELAAGRSLLLARLAELGALLLVGVTAVVLGADFAFGRPVRRLRAAIEAWRSGADFTPQSLRGAPDEVLELAASFEEATGSLRRQEQELARIKEQQNLLVLEIHHRVKNNLQVIASLLNLQASRIRVPEARAEFQAARDRVRALATLHRHLYSEGELHAINMRSFLVELCGQLFQAMGEVPGQRIDLQIEAPELRLSSDQAVPLALIVTEAVTNSVKYAFPGGRHGHVSVRVVENAGELDLLISDDGVGIGPGRVETESGTRDGIGRQLIRGFARQLGASLNVEEGEGTRYAVRLSLRPPEPESLPVPLDAPGTRRDSAG